MSRKKRYKVFLSRAAEKDYKAIRDKKLLKRINYILDELQNQPFLGKPLHGEFEGCRSVKTFSFRIIYEIDDVEIIIIVLRIQHRRESYR